MAQRSNVSPATLPVHATEDGIQVEYLDGRRVTYRASPDAVSGATTVSQRAHVHVLLVEEAADHGRIVYVNDLDTDDEILESSGVGRILVDDGDEAAIGQGVDVSRTGEQVQIAVDSDVPDRTVFVFVENQLEERAYRVDPADEPR